MSFEFNPEKKERLPSFDTIAPAGDSLLEESSTSAWTRELLQNPELQEQTVVRKKVLQQLTTLYTRVPDPEISIDTAVKQSEVSIDETEALYGSFADMLAQDLYAKRLVLYFPFELLPQGDSGAGEQASRFKDTYIQCWRELLTVQDVRANFVDGDVLEPEFRSGDLPRVVKAAHLIPKLVECGFLSMDEILDLIETSEDTTLKDSIADTLPVLADKGLLQPMDVERMRISHDPLVHNMSVLISNYQNEPQGSEALDPVKDWRAYAVELPARIVDINNTKFAGVTPGREKWLKSEQKQVLQSELARSVEIAIQNAEIPIEELQAYLESSDTPVELSIGAIQGLERALIANGDYETWKPLFKEVYELNREEINDALESSLYRLHSIGVIDEGGLGEYKLLPRDLAGSGESHLNDMREDIDTIGEMTKAIEADVQLSKLIYPVTLVFGSRVKGYGARTADLDIGVFVKPGVSLDAKDTIRGRIADIFNDKKIGGKAMEFWLEESGDTLRVIDLEEPDPSQGEPGWTHILFGAAWNGDTGVIKELHEKLLTPYLYGDTAKDAQDPERWREEMERDLLQYRLMHKGYRRFNAPRGTTTKHGHDIDQDSAFFDPGYRRVATELFVRRVFLPQLKK